MSSTHHRNPDRHTFVTEWFVKDGGWIGYDEIDVEEHFKGIGEDVEALLKELDGYFGFVDMEVTDIDFDDDHDGTRFVRVYADYKIEE